MRHPDSGNERWGDVWFIKYAALFGAPLLFLIIAFHDREGWFVGLTTYLFCSVSFFAWRSIDERVTLRWRIGLAAVMLLSTAYAVMVALAGPGDTTICYDRISQPHRWAPMQNLGPDPNCRGTPLQNVKPGN